MIDQKKMQEMIECYLKHKNADVNESTQVMFKTRRRTREEASVIPNCYEPIIDKELWDSVQAIKANKSHKGK